MLIQAIRSLVFYALFLGQTIIIAIPLGTYVILRKGYSKAGLKVGRYWGASNLFLLRWVVGMRTKLTGLENLPEGGCIIASKHQSDWDIFALLPATKRPAFIAKKELMDIPFFGWAARSLETITIDRKRGGRAIADMTEDARAAIERGCQIIIFPEGTRGTPLIPTKYKFGTAKLYQDLNVPLVPVALNSGLCWGRNSLVLWPGRAEARILPAIPPGLDAHEAHKRMVEAIEAETNQLILEADRHGIARPMSVEMRSRLEDLRAAQIPE